MSKQSPIFCCDEAARGDAPARALYDGQNPFDHAEYVCQECFTPQQIGGDDCGGNYPAACGVMDGPSWDELGPVATL
jgi:hypothetical protein